MVSAPAWLKTDRTRRIICLVCFFLVELFVLINLVLSSDHPTAGLSWTILQRGSVDIYLGLRTVRGCSDGQGCTSAPLSDIPSEGFGIGSCAAAGGWVIASYVFVMVATIVPLFFLLTCGCVRIPYPKTIGLTATLNAFIWTIVAVSKWFEQCHNGVTCDGCSKKPGYSIALAILTIVIMFIGLVFYFWYTLRRQNPGAPGAAKSGSMLDSSTASSDGYGSAPAGGQFGGYNTPGSNSAFAMGAAAFSNPQVQQFGMAAAQNPAVQQWGAQQVQQHAQQQYGYGYSQ